MPPQASPDRDAVVVSVEVGPNLTPLLTAASSFVTAFKGEVHIVNAQPPPIRFRLPWVSTDPLEPGRFTAGLAMQRACSAVGIEASRVVLHVRLENRVRATLDAVRLADPAAIILGNLDGEGPLSGHTLRFLNKVIPKASLPTAVLRQGSELPFRRIVVATDFSPHADRALELATRWARLWGAGIREEETDEGPVEVELLHISDFARPGRRIISVYDALRSRLLGQAEATPQLRLTSRVLSAPLAPAGILAAVAESPPDLLFVGTHGNGPVGRAVFGSVAHEVVRRVTCSVVVVPLPS